MLRRIRIKNFQKHKRIDIEIDRLTSIVGSSDVGKSAIIRAIGWVLFNKPAGLGFITKGKRETRVRLDFDGFGVTRVRSPKVNEYRLHTKDGTQVFKSFKSDPPEPIVEILRVNEVNLQSQFDSPFWLGMNEMQASRALNEVVNLQSLDEARDKLNGMIRNHTSDIRAAESGVEATANQLKELEKYNLPKLKSLTHEVDRLIDLGIKDEQIGYHLQDLIDSIEDGQVLVDAASKRLARTLTPFLLVEQLIKETESARDEVADLFSLIQNCEETSSECHELADRLASVNSSLKEFKLCPKCKKPL